ncbi:MAG: toprim domain-containing protein [Candidatus Moraniibacteriota bacterium]|nr:toprim domain-containing protein [Candidatus Moranbacteria bacterium]HRZ34137.1 toprim domain-containing protein [Candidatus Moranbacteria bacterium]
MNYGNISPREYLREKNIEFREVNGELVMKCIFGDCDSDSTENEAHLWMNAETGQYQCKKCQAEGNLLTLAKHLGDRIVDVVKQPKIQKLKKVFDPSLVDFCHDRLPDEIRKYLNNRGLNNELINEYKLGWWVSRNGNRISIPVKNESGEYIYLKLRKDPSDSSKGNKYIFYPNASSSLFGIELLRKEKGRVFICEGELDCILLQSKGLIAVTSTAGAGTFKKEWIKEFEHLKEAYIVFDNDDEGRAGSEMVAKKLSAIDGLEVKIIRLPEAVGEKGDITDYFVKLNGTKKELTRLAEPFEMETEEAEDDDTDERKNQSDLIVELVKENKRIVLFHDDARSPYISLPVSGHNEILNLKDQNFKYWLGKKFWDKYKKAPNSDSINNALNIIKGEAIFNGSEYKLECRVAIRDDAIWYDLSNKKWQAVKITKDGWEIVDNSPIMFRRYSHQKAHPLPVRGVAIELLLPFINIRDNGQQLLLLVYIISCFIPGFPHPVINIYGAQGSAKSTLFKLIKKLVDPSLIEVSSFPQGEDSFVLKLSHHWCILFDNVSFLSDQTSDLLCKAVTGAAFSKRELYSDDNDVIHTFRRCLGINGINLVTSKPDLLERSLLFELDRIPPEDRKLEQDIIDNFEQMLPELLGSIFDIVSETMKVKPGMSAQNLTRMADFAHWGSAIARALGHKETEFLEAYRNNIANQNNEVLLENFEAITILTFMEYRDEWEGTASELLEELKIIAGKLQIDIKEKGFPKSANNLSKRINRLKTNLEEAGIKVYRKEENRQRIIRFQRVGKSVVSIDASLQDGVLNNDSNGKNDENASLSEQKSLLEKEGGVVEAEKYSDEYDIAEEIDF